MLITTIDQLESLVDRMSASDVVAIDTEFVREKSYYPKLCLIQLGTEHEQAAVDPFAVQDLRPLVRLFSNPFITKVFHACMQDMEVLLHCCGVLPWPLFDTQVALAYMSDRYQIGYGALVEEYCGVPLAKSESMTDWSRRPLDDAQLAYALDDVRYLPGIWRDMRRQLEERGRIAWLEDEFRRLASPGSYQLDPREAFRRVKRSGSLDRRRLAVVREVAAWRETRAVELNRPRRWVLPDELVVEIAKRGPANTEALARIRGMSEVSQPDCTAIVEAVRRGMACPDDECPELDHHARPTLREECVCDVMYALTRMIAEQECIAPAVLASRDDLMAYIRQPASSPVSRGWRHEVLGCHLDRLLSGEVGLSVKDGRVELL